LHWVTAIDLPAFDPLAIWTAFGQRINHAVPWSRQRRNVGLASRSGGAAGCIGQNRAPDGEGQFVNRFQTALRIEQFADVEIGRHVDVVEHAVACEAGPPAPLRRAVSGRSGGQGSVHATPIVTASAAGLAAVVPMRRRPNAAGVSPSV
jgi:hypothetical protein